MHIYPLGIVKSFLLLSYLVYLDSEDTVWVCNMDFYYIPINDTSFELSIFWLSDTVNRINELRFSHSVALSIKTNVRFLFFALT